VRKYFFATLLRNRNRSRALALERLGQDEIA